jgi:hypothetical protein
MQRRYFVRHKEITIEEIEGLVAVRADPQAPIDAQRQLVHCHDERFCYNMAIPISALGRCHGHPICRRLDRRRTC